VNESIVALKFGAVHRMDRVLKNRAEGPARSLVHCVHGNARGPWRWRGSCVSELCCLHPYPLPTGTFGRHRSSRDGSRNGSRGPRAGARPVGASWRAGLLRLALLLMSNDKDKDKEASKECMRKKVAQLQVETTRLLRELCEYLLSVGAVYEIVTVPSTC
jgi:hypothetical protein